MVGDEEFFKLALKLFNWQVNNAFYPSELLYISPGLNRFEFQKKAELERVLGLIKFLGPPARSSDILLYGTQDLSDPMIGIIGLRVDEAPQFKRLVQGLQSR